MAVNRAKLFGACALLIAAPALASASQSERDAAYLEQLSRLFSPPPASHSKMVRAPMRKTAGALTASEQLQALLDAHWGWLMQSNPEYATHTGYPGQNHRWSSYSLKAATARQAMQSETLVAARSIDRKALTLDEQLNLDLFLYDLGLEVAGHAFEEDMILVTPMYGVHSSMARSLANMPLLSPAQLEDYLARLEGMAAVLRQSTQTLKAGLKAGITPPRITLKKVPAQVYALAPELASDSVLLKPLLAVDKQLPGIEVLQARAETIYTEQIRPALLAFAHFLESEYLPGAVEATGLSSLPDGAAWYAWRVRQMTSTNLTPQQIHEIGLAEVARIQRAMFAIMEEVGFEKQDVPAFVKYLAQDASQFYASADDLVRDYQATAKQADAALVKLFTRYPRLPYAILPIPAHEAAGRSAAYYIPGSAENARPGQFFVNTSRLPQTPKYEREALLLHEAVPGHHFQIALQQELADVPAFRRFGGFTAFVEGWGLYAESLGYEIGFYKTPESRFGALTFEMWRALRLVVDTGLHALGWSRQQAIDYFIANTGRSLNRVSAEVDRYLVMPAQALSYKIGELRFKALRSEAERALGADFDLRQFHDQLLSEGALPLKILEARMQEWVQAQKMAQ